MKKIVKLLLVVMLAVLSGTMFAQHTKLYLPTWNDLSGTNCDKAAQVEHNQNFYFKSFPAYDGNRFKNNCTANVDQIFTNNGEYVYPAMLPLIIEAEVPNGVHNVVWNITGSNVAIISAPNGTQFLDKNHAITPVSTGSMKVTVENPYRVKKIQKDCPYKTERLKSYYSKEDAFVRPNFFEVSTGGGSTKTDCYLYNKNFTVGSGRAYIVVLATQEGYVHVSAVAKEKDAGKDALVVGRLHFINKDPMITCISKAPCPPSPNYNLVISGGPSESPIDLTKSTNFYYTINITNKSDQEVDLSQVILKIAPKFPWWLNKGYIFKQLDGTLPPKGHKTFRLSDDQINVDVSKVPATKGVLEATATILYPTSPINGKKADLDLTYSYKEVHKTYSLAGISTDLKYTYGGDYNLIIQNLAPDTQKDALLFIQNVKVGQNSYNFGTITPGSAPSISISTMGNIIINYYMKYTEKDQNGNVIIKKMKTQQLNIGQ